MKIFCKIAYCFNKKVRESSSHFYDMGINIRYKYEFSYQIVSKNIYVKEKNDYYFKMINKRNRISLIYLRSALKYVF